MSYNVQISYVKCQYMPLINDNSLHNACDLCMPANQQGQFQPLIWGKLLYPEVETMLKV
jgi:hypothetical protein